MSDQITTNSPLNEWVEKYQKTIDTPPEPGDILRAVEGDALLTVEIKEGSPPFIYGRAFVPEILSVPVKWYLQAEDSHSFHGWKCILMPRARAALIQKCGLHEEAMAVKSLRVIRHSQSGKSLLCEVHEYADNPLIVKSEEVEVE